MVKTLHFQYRGAGSIPSQGTKSPHAMKQWAKKKKIFLIDFKNPLRENKGKQEEEERMEKMILPEVGSG